MIHGEFDGQKIGEHFARQDLEKQTTWILPNMKV